MFKPIISLFGLLAVAQSVNAFTINPPEHIDIPYGFVGALDFDDLPAAYSYTGDTQIFTMESDGMDNVYTFYDNKFQETHKLRFNHYPTLSETPRIYDYFHLTDYTESIDKKFMYFTQTLFNTDEHYEFIIPIIKGENTENQYYTEYLISGYQIVADNGTVLATIEYPDDRLSQGTNVPEIYVFKDHITIMLHTYSESNNTDLKYLIYNIDRSELGGTIQPKLVNTIACVSPTLITNHEPINIDLGNIDTDCRIDIFNANGAIVYSTTVTAGTSSITVPTATLPHGVNIVHISDGNTVNKSTKVVVR